MSVLVRSCDEARKATALSLELPVDLLFIDDETLIAQSLRRAVVFLAPCSRAALTQAVAEALQPLTTSALPDFKEKIRAVLDSLCAVGDIVELATPEATNPNAPPQHLWSAPPSFVSTPGGRIYLLGSKGDAITFIPDNLVESVQYSRRIRFIATNDQELESVLVDYGLFSMTAREWVRRPSACKPDEFLLASLTKLNRQPDTIEDLSVLSGSGRFYRSRWRPLAPEHDGVYIAKRPQRFGADRWCLVQATNGRITKLSDVFATHSRERACDRAWMLQHALAAKNGTPENFRISRMEANLRLSLFFPIPNWAEKYILLMAEKVDAQDALMCFEFTESGREHILELLETGLWMTKLKE